jgi:phosphoribosyl 1,2-cyclic phosphodiesterase
MKICSLASGSRGNSVLVESEHSRILIDAGLSAAQIKERLNSINVDPRSIDGIAITHIHRDHVNGANTFSRQFNVPIYGHPDTLDELTLIFSGNKKIIPWTGPFTITDFYLQPFKVSHDAIPTVGYLITNQDKKMVICTDLGIITTEVEQYVSQAQFIILESNHDPEMLMNGPYPWELKERISSRLGHLSNHDTGLFLKNILHGNIQKILLAHLSEENNSPDVARHTVLDYLGSGAENTLDVIEQRKVSAIFEF